MDGKFRKALVLALELVPIAIAGCEGFHRDATLFEKIKPCHGVNYGRRKMRNLDRKRNAGIWMAALLLVMLGCDHGFITAKSEVCASGLSLVDGTCSPQSLTQNSFAYRPQMGFSTYYSSRIQRFQVNQTELTKIADDMNKYGLRNVGYRLLHIDIGWWFAWSGSPRHPVSREIIPAPLFPDLPGLIQHIHQDGLLVGLYTDTGAGDSAGCGGFPGSGAFIQQDVLQMAQWGIDFLKVDHCGGNPNAAAKGIANAYNGSDYEYQIWHDAIRSAGKSAGKQIVLNVADWNFNDRTPGWAPKLANSWRTQSDIDYRVYDYINGSYVYNPNKSVPISWNLIMRNFLANDVPPAAGPGHWNDPDHLLIGGFGLTHIEEQSYYNMWTIQSAPLILATYPADLAPNAPDGPRLRAMLLNTESIAINQDELGRQGEKVREDAPGLLVYSKILSGKGRRAVLLLNSSPEMASMTVHWGDIGLVTGRSAAVRDIVVHTDLGQFSSSFTAANIPSRGSRLLLIEGAEASVNFTSAESGRRKILASPAVYIRDGVEFQVALGLDRDYWFRSRSGSSLSEWSRIRPSGCVGDVIFFGDPALTFANGAINLVGLGYVDKWGANPDHITAFHSYSYDQGKTWSCYGDLGAPSGGLYGRLAIVAHDSVVDIHGRGQDNAMYAKSWSPSGGWSNWVREGGCLRSGISASVRPDGSVDLVVIGCDDQVWHGWYGLGWGVQWDKDPLSGSFSNTPSSLWDSTENKYRIFATMLDTHEVKTISWPKTAWDYSWGLEYKIGSCMKSGVSAAGASPVVLVGTACNTPGTNADTDAMGDTLIRLTY